MISDKDQILQYSYGYVSLLFTNVTQIVENLGEHQLKVLLEDKNGLTYDFKTKIDIVVDATNLTNGTFRWDWRAENEKNEKNEN